jgi:8-oxo-dGTP diphosphatase
MNRTSIACIAFDGRKVFIAHRNPVGQMGGRWEFPGGKVEEGEDEKDSIVRELQEEFGVEVTVGDRIAEASFKHNSDEFSLHAYLVQFPHKGLEKKFTLTEHTEYRWAELAEIPQLNFVDSDMLIYPQICKYLAQSLPDV